MSAKNSHRLTNTAGIAAPLVFIGAWLACGLITAAPYSPVDDAISQLAANGSDVRWLMTSGFVAFGVLMIVFAIAVNRRFGSTVASLVAANGVATWAVAATPLEISDTIDQLHNLAAIAGYVTLAAIPIAAYSKLKMAGDAGLAVAGLAVAVVAATALTLSVVGLPTGLFQRLGLTAVDLWVVAFAFGLRRYP